MQSIINYVSFKKSASIAQTTIVRPNIIGQWWWNS